MIWLYNIKVVKKTFIYVFINIFKKAVKCLINFFLILIYHNVLKKVINYVFY